MEIKQTPMEEQIKTIAARIAPELAQIRHRLHQIPELGVTLPETHDFICGELEKIPGLQIFRHRAEGFGIIALLYGEKGEGKTVLLRADMDALPIEETGESPYRSLYEGRMHACGHDGHVTWLIGAAKILSELKGEFGGCVKFVFQPGEEIGQGADALIEKDKVLKHPDVDMAFAAHGWPSVTSGRIGIARRYAFGCVGGFQVTVIGKKGHASWPEQTIDPIAVSCMIYQNLQTMLARKIAGTESKVLSVTYIKAGDTRIRNVIPEICEFGGTIRTAKKETMQAIIREMEREISLTCEGYGASYDADIQMFGEGVRNSSRLIDDVRRAAAGVLGEENAYIIEDDNLGGENFAQFANRVPSVYLFVGIRPAGKETVPGLHSPDFRFDDSVLAGAAGALAAIAYHGCRSELEEGTGVFETAPGSF